MPSNLLHGAVRRVRPSRVAAPLLAALALSAVPARAFDADGAWPDGTITLTLQLDRAGSPSLPTGGMIDGSASWNAAVLPTLDAWNLSMTRTKLAASSANPTPADSDGVNNVFFASTIYGEAFGARVLAVTLTSSDGTSGVRLIETDVVFNTAISWNSYRGALRTPEDIRRVAQHEFGHAIGLHHPDQATPVQNVVAIMNATVSNIDALQTDDRNGAIALYGTAIPVPAITRNLQSKSVAVGANASLDFELNGGAPPAEGPTRKYVWTFDPTGTPAQETLFAVPGPVMYLGAAQLDDRGTYRVKVETPNGFATSSLATVNVSAVTTSAATRMTGLSTRGIAGSGSRTMTVGFTISGGGPRRILVRGKGPKLASYGVANTVADPILRVFSGTTQIGTNDNWQDGGQGPALATAFTDAGLDSFDGGSKDAALIMTLAPGTYTAQVVPANGVEGIALIEAYDLDATTAPAGRFLGLSTRGQSDTGGNALTGGLIVAGAAPRTFLIRALGDSLNQYGVTGTLDDPTITLYSLAGGAQKLRVNDDWDSPEFLQPKLTATATALSLANASPTDRQESVMQVTLPPGPYTIEVRGLAETTGVTLLEVYEVPE